MAQVISAHFEFLPRAGMVFFAHLVPLGDEGIRRKVEVRRLHANRRPQHRDVSDRETLFKHKITFKSIVINKYLAFYLLQRIWCFGFSEEFPRRTKSALLWLSLDPSLDLRKSLRTEIRRLIQTALYSFESV